MSSVRAINGFKILRSCKGKTIELIIRYEIDGEFFTQSKYYNVSEEKIREVKERLDDFTKVNSEATELCRTIIGEYAGQ